MELQQVRYFLALCETLNFTRAAERCNVTQPSLTRAIQALEAEFGGPVLAPERTKTPLTHPRHAAAPDTNIRHTKPASKNPRHHGL